MAKYIKQLAGMLALLAAAGAFMLPAPTSVRPRSSRPTGPPS
jgi:hypothetical protein